VGERLVITLDTHALLWWLSAPDRIPTKARRLLDGSVTDKLPVAVSSITLWEIAMLVDRKRLELTIPVDVWITHVQELPWLSFIPVDNRIAVSSVYLDGFPHRDPADRIIVATTLSLNGTLVTADARLRAYKPLRTAWD
jgi:PIN domain nuclease of toxin-antitoxin system